MLQKKNYSDDILHNIRRLSEVNEQRDIKPLMATSFPGTHCPLMGSDDRETDAGGCYGYHRYR